MEGKAIKYGDNIDTDVIIPARFLNTSDPIELSMHCMEDIDEGFKDKVKNGDIIVAGYNFGCGSSREHAPISIKGSGISCVIAKSFARIFYRNAINIGLPILECKDAVNDIDDGDIIFVNMETGIIKNKTKGKEYMSQPFPKFVKKIIEYGGLINYVKKKVSSEGMG